MTCDSNGVMSQGVTNSVTYVTCDNLLILGHVTSCDLRSQVLSRIPRAVPRAILVQQIAQWTWTLKGCRVPEYTQDSSRVNSGEFPSRIAVETVVSKYIRSAI